MATWMTHLRIADKFTNIIGENRLSLPEFVFGNVAPDCGILNADGMTYTPSKQISHYQTDGGNDYMRFANDYLKKCDDFKAKSFYLGYLLHLLTDIQWRELTVLPQIKKYGGKFDSKSALIWALKGDWYDIDRLFLRANPDFRAFKVFCETEHIANYVNFFPENAFDQQLYRIRDFYQNADCNLDREYKYMDYVDMDRFIKSAVLNIKTKYFAIAECHGGKIDTVGDVRYFSGSNYLFTDNNITNSAWNLYIYDCDLSASANSVILKKDTAKAYDAIIYSGHIKNALLNVNHYPNLKIADNSYMTATEGGEKDSAVSAFAAEYWVYESADNSLKVDCPMLNGAAIRLGKVNGIRFYMTVDQQKIADLRADGATVEYGILITAADLLGDEELTLDFAGDVNNVEFISDEYYTDDSGLSGIVGSIVDIKESGTSWSETSGNITRAFVGRGYIKVTKDGKTVVSYANYANGDIANNTRSLQYITNAYKSDTSSSYNDIDAEVRALVDKWASAVK